MAEFVYPVPADLEAIDVSKQPVHPLEHFYLPPRFKSYVKNIILPDGIIHARWARIAERILADYAGEQELTMIVLMNGGYQFYEDLKSQLNAQMRYLSAESVIQIRPFFVKLSSYKNTETTGLIKGVEALEQIGLNGKNVLLVEDMIDTGTTMKAVLNKIHSMFQVKSLRSAIAFHKKTSKNVEWGYFGHYTGFLVDNTFVIGYGMDINGHLRDIPHLCEISQLGIDTFRVEDELEEGT